MRRMLSVGRGLVAAMEEEEVKVVAPVAPVEGGEPVEEPTVVIPDNADSPETEMIEVVEAAADGEEQEAVIEETTEIVEALESIADALAVSAANGGLDKHAAAAVGIATQYMYDRVGIKTKSMPALESFGGTSTRIGSTQLALEDIKDKIKTIWAAIIAGIEKAIQMAKDFYTKVFSSFEKLGARAEELAKKAPAVGDKAANSEIENERLFKSLNLSGKIEVDKLVNNDALKIAIGSIVGKEFFINSAKEYAKDMADAKTDEEFIASLKIPGMPMEAFFSEISNPESEGFEKPKDGLTLYKSDELPGGKTVVYRIPKSELTGKDALAVFGKNGLGATFAAFNPKAEAKDGKLPVLSKEQAANMAKFISDLCKTAENYKKNLDEVNRAKNELITASKKMASSDADIKAARIVATTAASNIDQPAAAINVYALGTFKAMLDYIEQSLKEYKSDTPAAKEEKAAEPAAA